MVAPIALYPDTLLAQIFMASTYPLEIVQAQRWLNESANAKLKGDELAKALEPQTWDPSVKSLVPFPQVLGMMNDKLDWTQRLGDAFLAQQADVMEAVQRLRRKAQDSGTLKSNEQQTVTTEPAQPAQPPPATAQKSTTQTVVTEQQTIVIQPANPQVVYVPTYNPTTVYGAWPYPAYPPVYYPPPAAYYPYYPVGGALVSGMAFATGVAVVGSLWGWGGCNWGHNDININSNRYNTINNNNIRSGRANQLQTNQNNWRHDSGHRGGVAYRDNATRQNYQRQTGGSAQARQNFRGYDGGQRTAGQGSSTAGAGAARGQRQAGASSTQTPGGAAGAARTGQGQRASPTQTPGGAAGAARSGQTQRTSPQAFQGVGNGGQVQAQANRGQFSRQSAAASAPRYSGGGGARMGGGGRGGGGRR